MTARSPETRSLAVGVNVAAAPSDPVASIVWSASVSAGPVVSRTVVFAVAVPVLPAASVAVQVTVVSPRAKVLPEAGV